MNIEGKEWEGRERPSMEPTAYPDKGMKKMVVQTAANARVGHRVRLSGAMRRQKKSESEMIQASHLGFWYTGRKRDPCRAISGFPEAKNFQSLFLELLCHNQRANSKKEAESGPKQPSTFSGYLLGFFLWWLKKPSGSKSGS